MDYSKACLDCKTSTVQTNKKVVITQHAISSNPLSQKSITQPGHCRGVWQLTEEWNISVIESYVYLILCIRLSKVLGGLLWKWVLENKIYAFSSFYSLYILLIICPVDYTCCWLFIAVLLYFSIFRVERMC